MNVSVNVSLVHVLCVWLNSGRKKAVFIGINYFGTQAELRGMAHSSHFFDFLNPNLGHQPPLYISLSHPLSPLVGCITSLCLMLCRFHFIHDYLLSLCLGLSLCRLHQRREERAGLHHRALRIRTGTTET